MNICVFCSCSNVGDPYESSVRELGRTLGAAGNTLVYGGFAEGLMGAIADGFADAGAPVVGVVPRDLAEAGRVVHPACREVCQTRGLTDRKSEMIVRSDAFVVAPGGVGTLDELFSVLGMVITHELAAPVVIYNAGGFYDKLRELLSDMEDTGFIRSTLAEALLWASTPEEALAQCAMPSRYGEIF